MNNDPDANTKSTPRTDSHIAENSRYQYDIEGLLKVNSIIAVVVINVPTPETSGRKYGIKMNKNLEKLFIIRT